MNAVMTEELFREDSYQRSCEARVLSVSERGLILDRTVFYPTGGGQPGDTGSLVTADGTSVVVVDTRKDDETGCVTHLVEGDPPLHLEGVEVTATIDWDRRHRLMRVHTLLHLLCSLIPAG